MKKLISSNCLYLWFYATSGTSFEQTWISLSLGWSMLKYNVHIVQFGAAVLENFFF